VRTIRGVFGCGRPHFVVEKTLDFFEIYGVSAGTRREGVDLVRIFFGQGERESVFCDFARTSFTNGPPIVRQLIIWHCSSAEVGIVLKFWAKMFLMAVALSDPFRKWYRRWSAEEARMRNSQGGGESDPTEGVCRRCMKNSPSALSCVGKRTKKAVVVAAKSRQFKAYKTEKSTIRSLPNRLEKWSSCSYKIVYLLRYLSQ